MFGNNDSDDGNDDSTSDDYEFLASEESVESEEGGASAAQQNPAIRKWTLGEHTASQTAKAELDGLLENVDSEVDSDLYDVLSEATSMAKSVQVGDFECPVCGLNHGHSDSKHDIRSSSPGFNVTGSFASQMKYCPYCHCGVNELAMLIDFYGYIDIDVFQTDYGEVDGIQNYVLQEVMQTKREAQKSVIGDLSMEEAVEESGNRLQVPRSAYEDLEAFYRTWRNIKDAADGAPIPSKVRRDLDKKRRRLEEKVA